MIYDCFIFFNELDLLEIRLNILNDIIDKFVLVESDRTFTNKEKPFYFDENKERYKQFLDKIIHIKISEYPEINNEWDMEHFQRNQITLGLSDCLKNDIILISDLDEIPNPETINKYINNINDDNIYTLKQLHFAYFINYQRIGINKYWKRVKILRYDYFISNKLTPQMIRSSENKKIIKNGGWHFSFLGGLEKIKNKIQSFSHQEWNNDKFIDDEILSYKIQMGLDLFDRKGRHLIPVKISYKKHPKYIVENQEKYKNFIYPHINKYVVIKNTILCLPYAVKDNISKFIKSILPKSIVKKIKDLKNKKQ